MILEFEGFEISEELVENFLFLSTKRLRVFHDGFFFEFLLLSF